MRSKNIFLIIRWIVGILFIFSGLVKANDPLGLAYKMQEFFEAWANSGMMPAVMNWLNGQALMFSILMITMKIPAGSSTMTSCGGLSAWHAATNFLEWMNI